MILKAVTFFLIFMLVLGMFGKLRLPKVPRPKILTAKKCSECGMIDTKFSPCSCNRPEGS